MDTLAIVVVLVFPVIFALELGAFTAMIRRMQRTLDRMESAAEVVAQNLADSVARADATEGPEGAAADAALRTPP